MITKVLHVHLNSFADTHNLICLFGESNRVPLYPVDPVRITMVAMAIDCTDPGAYRFNLRKY